MSTAAVTEAPPVPATRGWPLTRVSGVGGLLFVLLLVVDNVIRSGAPKFGASGNALTAYIEGHRFAMMLPIALFPLGVVGLFAFVAGVWSLARDDARSRWWVHAGVLGVAAIAALFSVVNLVEAAMVATEQRLASAPSVLTALWAMDGAAFGLNLVAIGIALLGLSRAARASRLIPGWLAVLAVPGACCLMVASLFAIGISEGAAWLYLGIVGFLVWALFVLVTGISLVRRGPQAR